MAIPPVKPGGYGIGDVPKATELAQIDERISQRGLDSVGDDTLSGTLSIQQDPLQLGVVAPTLTMGTGSSIKISAGQLETKNGGRLYLGATGLGANDWPGLSPAHTRTIRVSALEACRSAPHITLGVVDAGNALGVYGNGIGIYTLVHDSGGTIHFSIPKPNDTAVLSTIRVWFFCPVLPTAVSDFSIIFGKRAVSGSVVPTSIASNATSFADVNAQYNNGLPQSISLAVTETIDLPGHTYFLQLIEDMTIGNQLVYTAIEYVYSTVSYENFTQ